MVFSSAEIREIKTAVVNTFNEKFLQELAEKVVSMIEKRFDGKFSALNDKISTIENKIAVLERNNIEQKRYIDNLEQSARSLNLRIFGLPVKDGENVRSEVLNLFIENLKLKINEHDIEKCYRVLPKIVSDKPPAVLVRFKSDEARLTVLRARKLFKSSVYSVKEDLTKMRLDIFNSAVRRFSRRNAWVLNGNIYIKCNNTVHRVDDENSLDTFVNN